MFPTVTCITQHNGSCPKPHPRLRHFIGPIQLRTSRRWRSASVERQVVVPVFVSVRILVRTGGSLLPCLMYVAHVLMVHTLLQRLGHPRLHNMMDHTALKVERRTSRPNGHGALEMHHTYHDENCTSRPSVRNGASGLRRSIPLPRLKSRDLILPSQSNPMRQ